MLHKEVAQISRKAFQKIIYDYYKEHRRSLVWREKPTPYYVLVSEIMLQQTQVPRVIPKFDEFIARFPNFKSLASAPVGDILKKWHGLGYNRRALNLQRAAQVITKEHKGVLPKDVEKLDALPGIGPATARSIAAFAFDMPVVFIETNIRTVFIHFFFGQKKEVHDDELMPLIQKMLDYDHSREWYYALMDYGVHLKKTVGNVSRQSKHYAKQSNFKTSNRRIRGLLLKHFVFHDSLTEKQLVAVLKDIAPEKIQKNLVDLVAEGFLVKARQYYKLA